MTRIQHVAEYLDQFAPTRLAEDWDNVGLLVGDASRSANRVMTCLTITPESAAEAIERQADLIVAHHPLPFKPIKRLTTDSISSKMLWDLVRAGISIYSPHTGFDSASDGINQNLASRIGLTEIRPLVSIPDDPDSLGAGRIGKMSGGSLMNLITDIKKSFHLKSIQYIGDLDSKPTTVAVACGSGGSFLSAARRAGCNAFVTGETNFHTCLEAAASNICLILLGHFASERFAVEMLADRIKEEFNGLEVWASQFETDPIRFH